MFNGPNSEQLWFTGNQILIILSVLFVAAVATAIWVTFLKWRLKWRIAAQNASERAAKELEASNLGQPTDTGGDNNAEGSAGPKLISRSED